MILKFVQLKNFRNYLSNKFTFNEKKNIICGKNGTGKTSLLEAIYILSTFKSFRSPDFFLPHHHSDFYYIKGEFYNDKKLTDIEVSYSKSDKKKKIKKNFTQIRNFSQAIGSLKIVLFLQSDLNLIDGSPEIKRKFMDTLFSQIDKEYYSNLIKFNKVLESRNFVLKQQDRQKFKNIEILNEPLIQYGATIIFKRLNYLAEIFNIFSAELKKTKIIDPSQIKIKYINNKQEISCSSTETSNDKQYISEEAIRENYLKTLNQNLKQDLLAGYTIYGPHRDNFIFQDSEAQDLSGLCSTGEKRTITAILKFSEFLFTKHKTGETPVILMDDILLELDRGNLATFIEFINNTEAQFFITAVNGQDYQDIKEKEVLFLNGEDR